MIPTPYNPAFMPALTPARAMAGDIFNIALGTLGGASKILLSNPYRQEMNHALMSPDGQWVSFVIYTLINTPNGSAIEGGNYLGTAVGLLNLGLNGWFFIQPPQPTVMCAGAVWGIDDQGFLVVYFSTNQSTLPGNRGGIGTYSLRTGQINYDAIAYSGYGFGDPNGEEWGAPLDLFALTHPGFNTTIYQLATGPLATVISQSVNGVKPLIQVSNPVAGDTDPHRLPNGWPGINGSACAFSRKTSNGNFIIVAAQIDSLGGINEVTIIPNPSGTGYFYGGPPRSFTDGSLIGWFFGPTGVGSPNSLIQVSQAGVITAVPIAGYSGPGTFFLTEPAPCPPYTNQPWNRITFSQKRQDLA